MPTLISQKLEERVCPLSASSLLGLVSLLQRARRSSLHLLSSPGGFFLQLRGISRFGLLLLVLAPFWHLPTTSLKKCLLRYRRTGKFLAYFYGTRWASRIPSASGTFPVRDLRRQGSSLSGIFSDHASLYR